MDASRILTEWLELSRPIPPTSELSPVPQAASLIVPLGYVKKRKLSQRRIAIFFHAFYAEEMAAAIDLQLRNLPFPVDVYFTTDTGAALRAAEMKCDALFKGTSVDGVYEA